ncbi:MAG TPA: hypothetical protein VNA26_08190 [Chitinophagaceae bacterium]|nr:hypothetical protein [Chitinophagaceae bacterium]
MGKTMDKNRKIRLLRNQINRASKGQPTDLNKLFGLLKGKIKEDPVVLQRKWRDEDR